ncbi:MAG: CopD family protein [Gammaproteobacteria bacterium]|nr:CopD family protein [Gammaproteobacteria bacterium]MDE2070017.1 CopD family protein [Gammaproteobacteria bacterium]
MLWVLAFHIIFMATWFAGLFYLPRLFVYHSETHDEPGLKRFETMEWRLYVIMSIGAIGTIAFGLWLLFGWWLPVPGWLQAKLALVVLLILYHIYCCKLIADFRRGRNRHGTRFFRWFNEIPALFLLAIVILAVVKPF